MVICTRGNYVILQGSKKQYIAIENTILEMIDYSPQEFLEIIKPFFSIKYFLPYIYIFYRYLRPYINAVKIEKGVMYKLNGEKITIIQTPTYQYDFVKEDIYKFYYTA